MKRNVRLLVLSAAFLIAVALAFSPSTFLRGQQPGQQPQAAAPVDPNLPPSMSWTTAQDHQNMMEQLGIKTLRPGPSGTETAPNHANYDEVLANPYPNLPDVLTLKNGRKVTTAAQWTNQRRPEIVEDFDREVFGRVPKSVPKVTWTVTKTVNETVAGRPVIGKALTGHVDNSSFPAINVDIQMTLVVPADAKGPVPVMMMFGGRGLPGLQPAGAAGGFGGFGAPPGGGAPGAARRGDPGGPGTPPAAGGQAPPAGGQVSIAGAPPAGGRAGMGGAAMAAMNGGDPPSTDQLIADGWGVAGINPGSIQADNGAGLTKGIIGLVNKGMPRKPDDWGALRAWAWGAARGLDYLQTNKTVDSKKVGIEGVSRYGKAALVTMAYDTRFAVVLIGSSGEGGAKLHRRNWGEAVENLTG